MRGRDLISGMRNDLALISSCVWGGKKTTTTKKNPTSCFSTSRLRHPSERIDYIRRDVAALMNAIMLT